MNKKQKLLQLNFSYNPCGCELAWRSCSASCLCRQAPLTSWASPGSLSPGSSPTPALSPSECTPTCPQLQGQVLGCP